MKILSLNCEGDRHIENVTALLATEAPDCVCLQECPESLQIHLKESGYYVSFVPLAIRGRVDYQYQEGLLLASRLPHTSTTHYYREHSAELAVFTKENYQQTMKKAVLHAVIGDTLVATTHFTWTPEGATPDELQCAEMVVMTQYLDTLPPHVLCGDFNIPRGYNRLYDECLSPRYVDTVPETFTSSLDRSLHRYGNTPGKEHLFEDYMVDYLFVQSPIAARDVRLVFGVSDHAAVLGEVFRTA